MREPNQSNPYTSGCEAYVYRSSVRFLFVDRRNEGRIQTQISCDPFSRSYQKTMDHQLAAIQSARIINIDMDRDYWP